MLAVGGCVCLSKVEGFTAREMMMEDNASVLTLAITRHRCLAWLKATVVEGTVVMERFLSEAFTWFRKYHSTKMNSFFFPLRLALVPIASC